MKFFAALFALVLAGTQTFASEETHLGGRFGLGFGGGAPIPVAYSLFRDSHVGWMAEGHGDMYLTDAFGIEGQFQHLSYQGGQPLNNTYTLGFLFRTMPTARWSPVVGLAAGWGFSTAKINLDSDYSSFVGIGKIGLDYTACDNLIIGFGAKYSWLFSKNDGRRDQQAITPQINFTYFFGKPDDVMPQPAATPSASPSSTPVPVAAVPVVDGDDDKDGVPNSVDKCPNTPVGAKVNSFGCQEAEAVNQTVDIEFMSGKSTLPGQYTDEADKIVTLMKDHADVNAEIQGYTDNVGKSASNQKLSEARAKSVRNYIVKHGIDASRVTAKGYGEESPIADNSTAEGRKQNRRVIASLKSK